MGNKTNTTRIGRQAEETAAVYLLDRGYEILDRNWRTRRCEIDIIAYRNSTVYFIEVKSRTSKRQGQGLDYITPQKQQQMRFAAEVWVARKCWKGPYCLGAIGLDNGQKKFEFIELI